MKQLEQARTVHEKRRLKLRNQFEKKKGKNKRQTTPHDLVLLTYMSRFKVRVKLREGK